MVALAVIEARSGSCKVIIFLQCNCNVATV